MAVLYDGIEPMLADMQWSTKSAYQINLTFYVISQPPTEDLLRQTVTWQDDAVRSVNMYRDGKSSFTATRPSGRVPWRRKNRCRVKPAVSIRGQDKARGGAPANCPA
jgi:hypothetical protein